MRKAGESDRVERLEGTQQLLLQTRKRASREVFEMREMKELQPTTLELDSPTVETRLRRSLVPPATLSTSGYRSADKGHNCQLLWLRSEELFQWKSSVPKIIWFLSFMQKNSMDLGATIFTKCSDSEAIFNWVHFIRHRARQDKKGKVCCGKTCEGFTDGSKISQGEVCFSVVIFASRVGANHGLAWS